VFSVLLFNAGLDLLEPARPWPQVESLTEHLAALAAARAARRAMREHLPGRQDGLPAIGAASLGAATATPRGAVPQPAGRRGGHDPFDGMPATRRAVEAGARGKTGGRRPDGGAAPRPSARGAAAGCARVEPLSAERPLALGGRPSRLAIRTRPEDCSWGPRDLYCCRSLWNILLGPG
jgi:hypothetical protein